MRAAKEGWIYWNCSKFAEPQAYPWRNSSEDSKVLLMKPNQKFLRQPKHFWANVRSISQQIGYTERGTGRIKVPSLSDIGNALTELGLKSTHVMGRDLRATELGENLLAYFEHRA